MNWTEMKERVVEQMNTDPQRATLSTRAYQAVEEGLVHLRSVGYQFEIAPAGTLRELVEVKVPKPPTIPLSMKDAVKQIQGKPAPAQPDMFEARSV